MRPPAGLFLPHIAHGQRVVGGGVTMRDFKPHTGKTGKLLDYVAVLPAAVTDHEAAGVVGLRVRGKHTQPVYGRLYAVDLPE